MRTDRIISSIPKDQLEDGAKCPHVNGDNACPVNSTNNSKSDDSMWVYPSPKMFWEAMNRKGTLPAHLTDPSSPKTQEELDWIVTIHNVVNEQCWQEICKWERFRRLGCENESDTDNKNPVLQRFLGRPDDLSPRAWFKSTILGYRRPFDRHDWYVRSSNNNNVRRYIIDFYTGKDPNGTASFYLDVRPAIDTFDAVNLRMRKYLCEKMKEFKQYFNK